MDVDVLEVVGTLLKTRIGLKNNVVLIELSENGGDLALAKGVIERIVDGLGKNAEPGGGVAIDYQIRF